MKNIIVAMVLAVSLAFSGTAMADAFAVAQSDQAQVQGQVQSQGQSARGGSVVDSGKVLIKGSFNGSAPIRYLPVPSVVPMENYQAQIFGAPAYGDKGPNFISMRQLVGAMNAADLKSDVSMKNIKITVQPMGPPGKKSKDAKGVVFELNDGEAVNHGFKPVAVLSVVMKRVKDINSASLAMAIGKAAKAKGAYRVVFLTEGSTKRLESGGWGIGLSYNMASVGSDPNDTGSVGAGGTGYSRGWGGYKDLIYLTAIVGN